MPANIEIKARVRDSGAFEKRAAALRETQVEIIQQEDVFFQVTKGRLKLRILSPSHAQLICYTRSDAAGPKRSEYFLHETHEPESLRMVLSRALGVRGIVRKTRRLFKIGQTRVHFDCVEGLGTFVELEVVLREGQSDEDGQAIAEDLMARLAIDRNDLVGTAYIDLIEQSVSGLQEPFSADPVSGNRPLEA